MILSGVYQIVNQINSKCYIGSSIDINRRWTAHKNALNANKHKNPHLQNAWNKYGGDNFRFWILCFCCKDKTLEFEQFFLDTRHPEYNIAKCARASMLGKHHTKETREKLSRITKVYNKNFGCFWSGKHHTEKAKRKMSEVHKNPSAETRQKMSKSQKGRHTSAETRRKQSEAHKNPSAETRRKISEAGKGRHLSEETKRKISEAHKGIHHSEETRRKLSKINKGKHYSEKTKQKISETHKGNKNYNWINFTEEELQKMQAYRNAGDSYETTSKRFNTSPNTVTRRLNSLERKRNGS